MIHSITVTNPKGESLELELARPEKSGLMVRNVDGLGPPKADVVKSSFATVDGGRVHSVKIPERNIVITLAMMFEPTIEDARQKTYRYFPLKKQVTLRVKTSNRDAVINGVVESNEPDIFSEAEETQISIVCVDPYFYELGGESIAFNGVLPAFEFPFSNESLTESLLEFGELRFDTRTTFEYIGDADTGVDMVIQAVDSKPIGDLTIYNVDTRESMLIYMSRIKNLIGRDLVKGEQVRISTFSGGKDCKLFVDGREKKAINLIDKDSSWFKLSAGNNTFEFVTKDGVGLTNVSLTFNYRNAYGGI